MSCRHREDWSLLLRSQNKSPSCLTHSPLHPPSSGRLWELSGRRVLIFVLMRLSASEVTANYVLCTDETNDIQVISEEELRRDGLGLPRELDQEQAVEEDRQMGRRGVGGAGDLAQTPRVPAALLMSQEDQDAEDPERDQLVIRDGHEEQDAGEEGGQEAVWAAAFPKSPSWCWAGPPEFIKQQVTIWWFILFATCY